MKMNSRTISRPNTFYHWKEGGGGGKTEEDNWLETYFSAEIQTLIVIAGNVTMSHRGERKQCHGIKEQYAARILSHPLLSIYTCGYIVTKRSVFDERRSSATLQSFYETSSLEKSRILFYESRNDIYIYISSSSRFIFPFVFLSTYAHGLIVSIRSVCIAHRSFVKNNSSKQRRGRNRLRWVSGLLAIIRNNTRDGLKTGELEFQWCLERYAISNARQRITNYVSNLHLEYR